MKFLRNLREIDKKIWTDSSKIMETLFRKIEVIWNRCWRYYEEILENVDEVISVKSKKTTKKSNKNCEKI